MRTFSLVFILLLFPIIFQCPVLAEVNDRVEMYRNKGFEAQQEGFFKKALKYYHQALEEDSLDPDIYNDIGVVREREGNFYEAKRNYFRAIELDDEYLPAYSNLAYLYKRQGDFITAIQYFKKRMKLGGPSDPWTEEAGMELRELSQISPELKKWVMDFDAQVLEKEVTQINLAIRDQQKKDFSEQVSQAKRYLNQSQIYEQQGFYDNALAEYDKALALTSGNPNLMKHRENLVLKVKTKNIKKQADVVLEKLESGDIDSSKEEFRKILTFFPSE